MSAQPVGELSGGAEPPPESTEPSRYSRTSSGVTAARSAWVICPTLSSSDIRLSRSSTVFRGGWGRASQPADSTTSARTAIQVAKGRWTRMLVSTVCRSNDIIVSWERSHLNVLLRCPRGSARRGPELYRVGLGEGDKLIMWCAVRGRYFVSGATPVVLVNAARVALSGAAGAALFGAADAARRRC